MHVGADPGKGSVVVYWTCDACHQQGLTPTMEQKLLEGRR
jgi:hypothetical protein